MIKVITAVLFLSSMASADDLGSKAKFKIKQVIKAQHQVVVTASEEVPFAPGKNFVATFDDGAQCSLTLSQINGKMLTLDSSPCDEEKRLTLKTPIEAALVTQAAAPVAAASADAPVTNESQSKNNDGTAHKTVWGGRFGVILSGSYASEFAFSNSEMKTNNTTYEFDLDMKYKDKFVPGVGISYSKMEENSWGFSGSLYYEFPREIDQIRITTTGGSSTLGLVENMELSFFLIEANIVYRWERLYVPFGLSLSIPHLKNSGDVKEKPGIGLYGALGTMITEDAALEFYLRAVGMRMTATDGAYDFDFGNGISPTIGVSARYWF